MLQPPRLETTTLSEPQERNAGEDSAERSNFYRTWVRGISHPEGLEQEAAFDGRLELRWRQPSELHWTPIAVCQRAARLLAPVRGERVLDVGSGVGKFCIVGAAATDGTFIGVEQRPRLVRQAWTAAEALHAERVAFICADAFDLDWGLYECLYLYNPFEELTFPSEFRITPDLRGGQSRRRHVVDETARRLAQLRPGTRVATYHGFGGPMPEGFQRTVKEWHGSGDLEVWLRA